MRLDRATYERMDGLAESYSQIGRADGRGILRMCHGIILGAMLAEQGWAAIKADLDEVQQLRECLANFSSDSGPTTEDYMQADVLLMVDLIP